MHNPEGVEQMSTGLTSRLRIILALAAIATTALLASAQEFTDVPRWQWAWAYVQGVRDAGITTGYDDGSYQPSAIVDRDQMAVFIARAMCDGDANVPEGPTTATFTDAPVGFWAYKYVEYIQGKAVTGGYPDGRYYPEYVVTRDQMAVYVARAFELM